MNVPVTQPQVNDGRPHLGEEAPDFARSTDLPQTVGVTPALRDARPLLVTVAWIPATLWIDTWASLTGQVLLGVLTWALLFALLAGESRLVRAQAAVVVVIAAGVELVFSGWLGVYVYRLEHVPMYVFPGHGLVYLAALSFGRLPMIRAHTSAAVRVTAVVAAAWALWGLALSPRHDVLGFVWFLFFLGFLRWGRSTTLYVGAFVVVSYLELLGTGMGVWNWMPRDTILGWVPQGNPPSVAAGGYGWFDLYAVLLAPGIVRLWDRATGRSGRSPEQSESEVAVS